MKLIIALFVLSCCSAIHAATYMGVGCPEGHAPGETWTDSGCQECSCGDTTFSCNSCGLVSLWSPKPCYKEYDEDASYPDCCKPKIVCEGDPGFNASKVEVPTPTVVDDTDF